MRKISYKHDTALSSVLALALLLTTLVGCGKRDVKVEPTEPAMETGPVSAAEPTEQSTVETEPGRQDGDRYEEVVIPVADNPESLSITGTWQTASIAYADDGTMSPEYYVRFTDTEILYGHLKDGQFVLDHTDNIVRLEETATGGYTIQAAASNGVQYTYQTCESDSGVLEYYETWREEDFPDAYRGGASLSRIS